jgi:multidrug resistance efflux pump
VEIVPHGSAVKKDQVLVRFDDEEFLKKLRDAESAAAAGKLSQANAEVEFITAENLPMQLQAAKIKAEEAAEAWEYFKASVAKRTSERITLKQTERLEAEREELVRWKMSQVTTSSRIPRNPQASTRKREGCGDRAGCEITQTANGVSLPRGCDFGT